ncbi:MAG: UDP-glucose/GDP-mannose dehydrogenase family protein [Firmicutes bacterium]|nr:UDP-glucose/GDP-mannose dehydrogenase family protein [Bacillota bacterium]MCL5040615.1 UDP-glucose/GDP-mannose dehydrogenase family protein [Bacillota bacterium]
MKIGVVGAGYVGLTTAVVLASWGHDVRLVEKDSRRRALLARGEVPFFEPGLQELFRSCLNRLQVFPQLGSAFPDVNLTFLCVGTPPLPDGGADLRQVFHVAEQVARLASRQHLLVLKSTVPPGTAKKVASLYPQRVASNPEFLREGTALKDSLHPDRIIIGADEPAAAEILHQLYLPARAPIFITDPTSAEMIKYASNAFLATKISFINSIANICERVGADVEPVARGMGLDSRIGQAFLGAGLGYGGSCFPKDLMALEKLARSNGYNFRLLRATRLTNAEQRSLVVGKLQQELGDLRGKRVAFWGLTFKAGTDDLRQTPALVIIRALLRRGAEVSAFDPQVTGRPGKSALRPDRGTLSHGLLPQVEGTDSGQKGPPNSRRALPPGRLQRVAGLSSGETDLPKSPKTLPRLVTRPGLRLASDPYQAVEGAGALVIATDWPEFRQVDLTRVYQLMQRGGTPTVKSLPNPPGSESLSRGGAADFCQEGETAGPAPVIIDGRNLLNPTAVREIGFRYRGMGR